MKHVLLARPSSLIVNDMKKLMTATGMQPTPITSLDELDQFNAEDIGGIVVSTALSSPVKEKYWEVIGRVIERFPEKPIFLASYASVKSTKVTAGSRFSENSIDRELVTLEELDGQFSPLRDVLILTQAEISDESRFEQILHQVRSILNG